MTDGKIVRRDFLLGSIKASLTLPVLGLLPRSNWGQEKPDAPGVKGLSEPPEIHYSLNILADYLRDYSPPGDTRPPNGAWNAEYDEIAWQGSAPYAKIYSRKSQRLGALKMARRPEADGFHFEIDSTISIGGKQEDSLRATVECDGDPLLSIRSWACASRTSPDGVEEKSLSHFLRGHRAGRRVEIEQWGETRTIETESPLVSHWTILDTIRRQRWEANALIRCDLLHELVSYCPGQRLEPCGLLELDLPGRAVSLRGWLQRGRGVQPTHYWLEEDGLPLLVTYGLRGLALREIREGAPRA